MRNRYLNNQRKKMKMLKIHLKKKKYQPYDNRSNSERSTDDMVDTTAPDLSESKKLEFIPGVIVKAKLPEPCYDLKKTKAELKSHSSDIQYIDIPLPSGSEEIFIRFNDSEHAKQFLNCNFNGKLEVLVNEEEKQYWEKIDTDRTVKLSRDRKKQRGRDKLLKRAERELGKHIRFDETE